MIGKTDNGEKVDNGVFLNTCAVNICVCVCVCVCIFFLRKKASRLRKGLYWERKQK